MKTTLSILFYFFITSIYSQFNLGVSGSSNFLSDWTNFKPKTTDYKKPNEILSGIISSDKKLYRNRTYLLSGIVYVTNKSKLIIESGTIIRVDFQTCGTLVITAGASIFAEGEATNPIVFTSSKEASQRNPGDWGGIVILGTAPINRMGGVGLLNFELDQSLCVYGGNDDNSNSGILRYVRIEFPGRKFNSSKEYNGISLAGVGRKTIIENVQVSFSNDDSFECYGGNLTLNRLVSYRATDDDFDFTQGAQATISGSLALRYPYSSDISTSRCFEIDTFDNIEKNDIRSKETFVVAENMTLVNNEENNEGLVKEAIYISEKSSFSLTNSLISGFSKLVLLDKKIECLDFKLNKIKLKNLLVNNCLGYIESEMSIFNSKIQTFFSNSELNIKISNIQNKDFFEDCVNKTDFDFRLKSFDTLSSK